MYINKYYVSNELYCFLISFHLCINIAEAEGEIADLLPVAELDGALDDSVVVRHVVSPPDVTADTSHRPGIYHAARTYLLFT